MISARRLTTLLLGVNLQSLRRTGVVAGLTMLGLLASFGSQIIISARFGVSAELDAYLLALAVANIAAIHVGPLREASTPAYYVAWSVDREGARHLLGAVLTWCTLLLVATLGLVVVVGLVSLPVRRDVFFFCLTALVPGAICAGFAETMNGLLAVYNRPILQQGVRLLPPVTMLITLVALPADYGASAIAVGWSGGQLIMLLLQVGLLASAGLTVSGRHVGLRLKKAVWWPAMLLVGAYAIGNTYTVLERMAFTHAGSGLLSSYNFAVIVANILTSVFGLSVMTVVHPLLLQHGTGRNSRETWSTVMSAFLLACVVSCAAALALSAAAPEVVRLLFGRGKFDEEAVALTASALSIAVFVVPAITFFTLAGRALLSFGDTWAMAAGGAVIGVCGSALVGLASLLGSHELLLMQWLIANSVGACSLFYLLVKRLQIGGQEIANWCARLSVVLVAGVVVSVLMSRLRPYLETGNDFLTLALIGATAVLLYVSLLGAIRLLGGSRSEPR